MQREYNRLPLESISDVMKSVDRNRWYRHVFGEAEHIVRCPLGKDLVSSEVYVDSLQHIEIIHRGNSCAILKGKALYDEGTYRMHMSWVTRVPNTIERVILHFNLYGMGCGDTYRVCQDSLEINQLWADINCLDSKGRLYVE